MNSAQVRGKPMASNKNDAPRPSTLHGFCETEPNAFKLKTFLGDENRPPDDLLSSNSSHSWSPTPSNTDLDQDPTPDSTLSVRRYARPRWLAESNFKRRQEIESMHVWLLSNTIVRWLHGPSPSRPYKINPLFPQLQYWPSRLVTRFSPFPSGITVYTCCLFLTWLIVFSVLLVRSKSPIEPSQTDQDPLRLDCTTALWQNASACGIDGLLCRPFEATSFPFICPAGCADVQVLEPHTVGDQEILYRSFVIGGATDSGQKLPVYRGDSFICAAAIHAGIVSNTRGGCGILKREGSQSGFTSTASNGITSISFGPSFPLSFSLGSPDSDSRFLQCTDLQWVLFAISLVITIQVSLLATPLPLFFSGIFVIAFFQVALASDSPYFPSFKSVVSLAFERFLPATFVAIVLYWCYVRQTLTGMGAYMERTVLWLGGYWVGALNDYTFDKIPISRLTPHDLEQQPGAILALFIVVAVIIIAVGGQAWAFRIEGRLLRYLALYASIAAVIGCLIAIPGLNFRLHHYTIGLLLLPGTAIQTRPSLLYQGILLGLFTNGIARWGFASILQTTEALREDGQLGSALPTNLMPIISAETITFTLANLAQGFDGLSVLVNDVERYHQTYLSLPAVLHWARAENETSFFRFAFTGTYTLGGTWYGDYTKPGTWFMNGTWQDMLPGPSK